MNSMVKNAASDLRQLKGYAATAKPQVFVTGDGWFTYNLLNNVENNL